MPPPGASRLRHFAFAAALIAVNLIAFRHAIGWDVFYNTDTDVMLRVAKASGWHEAVGWITGPWIGAKLCLYYRPTSSWLIWGEWALFQWRAVGYHWVGMALHLGAALLFWRIAAMLLGGEWLGAVAALIFSLRPRNVRTLAVLTAQPDLVAAAFMFLSLALLLAYLNWHRATPSLFPQHGRWQAVALVAGSLVAALLSLGGKEMALSLPVLASLVILFDLGTGTVPIEGSPGLSRRPRRGLSPRGKTWLLGTYWLTFAAFMGWRTFAMSGLGYIPKGWRDPAQAVETFARSAGLYFTYPFASAVVAREWWPLAMFGVVAVYVIAGRRWPVLRKERVLLYGAAPGFIALALGAAEVLYGDWAGILTAYPWQLLGLMMAYSAAVALVIWRDRRAALFVALWGLFAFTPASYRVYDWPGKFFYIPQTFWAFGGALLLEAIAAIGTKRLLAAGPRGA